MKIAHFLLLSCLLWTANVYSQSNCPVKEATYSELDELLKEMQQYQEEMANMLAPLMLDQKEDRLDMHMSNAQNILELTGILHALQVMIASERKHYLSWQYNKESIEIILSYVIFHLTTPDDKMEYYRSVREYTQDIYAINYLDKSFNFAARVKTLLLKIRTDLSEYASK